MGGGGVGGQTLSRLLRHIAGKTAETTLHNFRYVQFDDCHSDVASGKVIFLLEESNL